MSEHSTIHTDPWIAALREMPSSSADDPGLKARVATRLSESILGLAPAVTPGSAHDVGTSPAGTAASVRGVGTSPAGTAASVHGVNSQPLTTASGVVPAASAAMRRAGGNLLAWLVPVFVAGVASGWAADRWYLGRQHTAAASRAAPPLTTSEPSSRVGLAASAAAPEAALADKMTSDPVGEALTSVGHTTPPAALTAAPAPNSGSDASMTAERQLLDAARTALSRGEPSQSIASLEKHVRRFPKGTLTEEREALYVRVLVAVGNSNAAQARGTAFRKRFPNSIFLPVIDRALLSISRRNVTDATKP